MIYINGSDSLRNRLAQGIVDNFDKIPIGDFKNLDYDVTEIIKNLASAKISECKRLAEENSKSGANMEWRANRILDAGDVPREFSQAMNLLGEARTKIELEKKYRLEGERVERLLNQLERGKRRKIEGAPKS